MPADICACSTTDTAGQIVHQPGCPAVHTVGLVVPAPGVGPLPTSTVTVLRSCAAHPGVVLDACPACLAAAEVERDAARRDGEVWEAEAGRYQSQRDAARREAQGEASDSGDLHERAAEAAHDAWMAAKVAQGFHAPEACPGSTDDAGHVDVSGRLLACRRCHQDIRPYADLDEATKELDRTHVRAVHGVYAERLAALAAERDAAREADAISRRLLSRQCDLARTAEAARDAARQTAEEYVRGLTAAQVRADEAHARARAYAAESDRPAACGHRRGSIAYGDDGPHCPTCERDAARVEAADAKAHHMDAPGGPRCACGLPSAHESGACRRCVALSASEAREAMLREALRRIRNPEGGE